MPELPEQKRERFKKEYGLDGASIGFFVANKDLSSFYEESVSEFEEWLIAESGKEEVSQEEKSKIFKLTANYLLSDFQGLLAGRDFIKKECKITPENFAEFVKMIYKGEISSKIAKMVLAEMFNKGEDPSDIVEKNNWGQMGDDGEVEKAVAEVISKNPKAVEDYKKGKAASLQFLAGQVMAATRGTAKPDKVQEILKQVLSK